VYGVVPYQEGEKEYSVNASVSETTNLVEVPTESKERERK